MLYVTTKVLQEFLWPLNLTFIALGCAIYFLYKDNKKAAFRASVTAFLILFVPSLPVVSRLLLCHLESGFPSVPVVQYPNSGAIVVLSGSTAQKRAPIFEAEERAESRLLPAARLYHAGKSRLIIATGGAPYEVEPGKERAQSEDMREILIDMGVPPSAIVIETKSRTTYENAVETKKILIDRGIQSILLVTSAYHMRRAMDLFNRLGVAVVAVPTSRMITGEEFTLANFYPTVAALSKFTVAIKEIVGRLVYSVIPLKSV